MKLRSLFICGLLFVTLLGGCGVAKNTDQAEAEVNVFHERWNKAQFREIFENAHMDFRRAQPAEAMAASLEKVRRNYGQFRSATKRSWGFHSDDGNTDVRLSYDSSFEHGNAVEEFRFRMTGDRPLLLSYDIMRPEVAARREEEREARRAAQRDAKRQEREAARAEREAARKAKREGAAP